MKAGPVAHGNAKRVSPTDPEPDAQIANWLTAGLRMVAEALVSRLLVAEWKQSSPPGRRVREIPSSQIDWYRLVGTILSRQGGTISING
jgi:hypothetical protein